MSAARASLFYAYVRACVDVCVGVAKLEEDARKEREPINNNNGETKEETTHNGLFLFLVWVVSVLLFAQALTGEKFN